MAITDVHILIANINFNKKREMKSKEEIEQLAKEVHYDSAQQGLDANGCFNQYQGFIKGYTQCQKDMADEIKKLKEIINGSL